MALRAIHTAPPTVFHAPKSQPRWTSTFAPDAVCVPALRHVSYLCRYCRVSVLEALAMQSSSTEAVPAMQKVVQMLTDMSAKAKTALHDEQVQHLHVLHGQSLIIWRCLGFGSIHRRVIHGHLVKLGATDMGNPEISQMTQYFKLDAD
eukprot:6260916-Amphidinium_carterae.2